MLLRVFESEGRLKKLPYCAVSVHVPAVAYCGSADSGFRASHARGHYAWKNAALKLRRFQRG
jgi:hypothetical protein